MHAGGSSPFESEWLIDHWRGKAREVNNELAEWYYESRAGVGRGPNEEAVAEMEDRIKTGMVLEGFETKPLAFTPGVHELPSREAAVVAKFRPGKSGWKWGKPGSEAGRARYNQRDVVVELAVEDWEGPVSELAWLSRLIGEKAEVAPRGLCLCSLDPDVKQAPALLVEFLGADEGKAGALARDLDRCFVLEATLGKWLPRGSMEKQTIYDLARKLGINTSESARGAANHEVGQRVVVGGRARRIQP